MKFLLDTHILIWVVESNPFLSKKHADIISDIKNEKFVSEGSFIELAIKLNIGKMPDFKLTLSKFISQVQLDGFKMIPISKKHWKNL